MSKVGEYHDTPDGPVTGYVITCPACNCGHKFDVGRWMFNGDFERPTFSPSMHVTTGWFPKKYPRFPILKPLRLQGVENPITSLPWEMIDPHASRAYKNHGQTLERLAERGGLSHSEAVAVLTDSDWITACQVNPNEANVRLANLVHDFYQSQPDSICHSFVRDGRIEFLGDCTHELAGKTVDLPDF